MDAEGPSSTTNRCGRANTNNNFYSAVTSTTTSSTMINVLPQIGRNKHRGAKGDGEFAKGRGSTTKSPSTVSCPSTGSPFSTQQESPGLSSSLACGHTTANDPTLSYSTSSVASSEDDAALEDHPQLDFMRAQKS
ncbi:unnamed protein product [Amoebophrya sp. A25]|nr:unnamed protein product [Amoebophrya sp. A25]|eukprot:GSA25T00005442001.1